MCSTLNRRKKNAEIRLVSLVIEKDRLRGLEILNLKAMLIGSSNVLSPELNILTRSSCQNVELFSAVCCLRNHHI